MLVVILFQSTVYGMLFQSTVYGMGFAFALIVAKKRKLLGNNGESQSNLCRVFIWVAGFLSVVSLIVSDITIL